MTASAPVLFIGIADFLLRNNVLADATASPRGINFRATDTSGLICRRKRSSCSFLLHEY
jgi:hypothetical protein